MELTAALRCLAAATLLIACLFGGYFAYLALFMCAYVGITLSAAPWRSLVPTQSHATEMNVIGFAHLPLLYGVIWSTGHGHLHHFEAVCLFFAAAFWFGQIADRAAFELLRNGNRLGIIIQASLLTGHRISVKTLLYDPQKSTTLDGSVPQIGETFWHYNARHWFQEVSNGFSAETQKRHYRSKGIHPFWVYGIWTATTLVTSFALSGAVGICAMIALSALVMMQSHLNEYVERYGLLRRILPSGYREPIGPRHLWHAPDSAHERLHQQYYDTGRIPVWPYPRHHMLWLALWSRKWQTIMNDRAAIWRILANQSITNGQSTDNFAMTSGNAGQAENNLATWSNEMDSVHPAMQRARRTSCVTRHERG